MDAEFVNAYIEKMKFVLDEFLTKNLILETQLQIATNRLQSYIADNERLRNELEISINKNILKEKKDKKIESTP